MKKLLVITTILVMSCASASAQWYLYPGNRKKNSGAQAAPKSETLAEPVPETLPEQEPESPTPVDSVAVCSSEYVLEIPQTYKVALILPIQSNSKASANFLEMYGGALLAVRDFGKRGKAVDLTVIDESDGNTPVTEELLDNNHLVIGPVNMENILADIDLCPPYRYLVSPLEPKAATLVDSCRIVQTPTPWKRQVEEIVAWVKYDTIWGDKVTVLKDSVQTGIGEQAEYLLHMLQLSGIDYSVVSNAGKINFDGVKCTRCLIASDRDAFINTSVRDLSVLATKQPDIILYGTSKIRNSLGIVVEHLHSLETHYTTAYFIDYDNPATKEFILSYRALFKNEPGSFAFQGYDTMHYFLNLYSKYGVQWYKKLEEYSEVGLQNDYQFHESDAIGQINTAVRRVVLGKDMSATLQ